ncbi:MAG: hypothetical protein JNJ49_11295 [Bdellovibrionaceae bacterium]|nr:hypothetical protein [Pseudobdellovibrionaceae bacterium]
MIRLKTFRFNRGINSNLLFQKRASRTALVFFGLAMTTGCSVYRNTDRDTFDSRATIQSGQRLASPCIDEYTLLDQSRVCLGPVDPDDETQYQTLVHPISR